MGILQNGPLLTGTDVKNFAMDEGSVMVQQGHDPIRMVIDMNPIADIRAAAVDGERPVFKGIQNKERQLFFRILIWTVVVATAGNDDGQVIGCPVRVSQAIRRSLTCGIGRHGALGVGLQ